MRRSLSRLAVGFAVLFSASAANAAGVFSAEITSNGQTTSSSGNLDYSTLTGLINSFRNSQISSVLPNYTTTSVANAEINYRGVQATLAYPTTGTLLVFTVPKAGINVSFQGTTRDDSQAQLLKYLQSSSSYGNVVKALVGSSPVEPLAGNPTSLMAQMAGRDFDAAFGGPGDPTSTTNLQGGEAGLGLEYSHFTQGGIPVDAMTIPLSYSFRFERDPRYKLMFEMPISYSNSGGSKTAAISGGVGLTIPLTDHWTITPKLSAGATGSIDLGSGGVLIAGSLTTAYRLSYWGNDFVFGGMVGLAKTVGLTIGEYSIDPHLTNEYLKGGILISRPLSRMGVTAEALQTAELQGWVIATQFFGSKLYDESFQEVGVAIGKPLPTFGRYIRLGASYFHADHSNGFMVNFGYTF